MNLYCFVSVTFFALPSLKTPTAFFSYLKIFSNRSSISDCRVFAHFLPVKTLKRFKRLNALNVSGGNKPFDADFRSALKKQDTLFITKFSKNTCSFGSCNSPNNLNLEKCGVKIYCVN